MAAEASKRRIVRVLQRFVLNPPVIVGVRLGLVPGHVLIETIGRRTGKKRRTVVGMSLAGSTGWVVAEQGRHAGYVRNIEANSAVRVCVRGRWRTGHAYIVGEDDPQARLDSFGRSAHAAMVRRFGTDLMTLRFDMDGP
jgi:deazaflavin-dependent oxidoreductase (nitroreductase family)